MHTLKDDITTEKEQTMERINTRDEQGEPTYEVVDGKRLFRNGEPHGPEKLPATQLDALWFNSVQEELCNFIEKEGLTLDEVDKEQLRKAVRKTLAVNINPVIAALRQVIVNLKYHLPEEPEESRVELPEYIQEIQDEEQ